MQTLLAVQALRAAAAIAVAAVHFNDIWFQLNGLHPSSLPLYPLASGVDLFFVISGFIMVYASEPLFAAPGASRTFMLRRVARVVPLYWVATLVMFAAMKWAPGWEALTKSLLFIPYPNGVDTFVPVLGVGWTLNFEMLYYALFAVAVAWRPTRAVPALAAILVGAVLVGAQMPSLPILLRYWSDPIVLEFVFGMALAMLYRRNIAIPIAARWCLIVLGASAVWLWAPGMPPSGYRALAWGGPAAAMVAGAVLGTPMRSTGRLAAFLRLIGDSSYSIYLIHPFVGIAVLLAWRHSPFPLSPVAMCVLGLAASIGAAIAVFLLFERPVTAGLRRLFGERRRAADPVLSISPGHGSHRMV